MVWFIYFFSWFCLLLLCFFPGIRCFMASDLCGITFAEGTSFVKKFLIMILLIII